ncbi:beta-galactosidase 10-like [Trifolium pratense]|nr:beta-galactosidase 10-like [Trifolium pratense]
MKLCCIFWLLYLVSTSLTFTLVYAGNVTYDGRSLIIDGQRKLLISASIHYPRSVPAMWPGLVQTAKEGGVDVIETYVFWNSHELSPGNYYFGGRFDLVQFAKIVQEAGMYLILRIGPFVAAEWNFGGVPVWLHYIPSTVFRTYNQPFMYHMEKFTTYIVNLMKQEKLFASQGGPIILSQASITLNMPICFHFYHGGTNFGRTAGGPFITTSYDFDAPIDEYGLPRLPKWGHLKELHKAIKLCEHVLLYGKSVSVSLGPSVETVSLGPYVRYLLYDFVGAGVTSVQIKGLNNKTIDLSSNACTYKIGVQGEHLRICEGDGLNSMNWTSTPKPPKGQTLTWYKAIVDAPPGDEPVRLDMLYMGKGFAWLNGEGIGRYWPRISELKKEDCVEECDYRGKFNPNKCDTGCGEPSQKWYHVPRSWFKPSGNVLVFFVEKGGDPTKIMFILHLILAKRPRKADVYTDSSGACAAFIANVDDKNDKTVEFRNASYHLPAWSVSILPDCNNVVFNTAKVSTQTNKIAMIPEKLQQSDKGQKTFKWDVWKENPGIWGKPDFVINGFVDHINTTKDTTDYLWHTTSPSVDENEELLKKGSKPVLLIESKGHALHDFVNQKYQGTAYGNGSHAAFTFKNPVSLKAGKNEIALLSMTVGLQNAGPFYDFVGAGVTSVQIKGLNNKTIDLSSNAWSYKIGVQGEHLRIYEGDGLNSMNWTSTSKPPKGQTLTWYKAIVDAPPGDEPVGLDMLYMGKGCAWLNGEGIGRYWPRISEFKKEDCVEECDYRGKFNPDKCDTGCGEPSQKWYHVPRSLFKPSEEKGGDPTKITFVRRKVVSTA